MDVFTYDLLHIDIYPHNGKAEARAFLQALKTKGYTPQVIVTDMNRDYSEPVRAVFPKAMHHECVFHALSWTGQYRALQWAQRLVKEVYGNDYAQTHPEAVVLKEKGLFGSSRANGGIEPMPSQHIVVNLKVHH